MSFGGFGANQGGFGQQQINKPSFGFGANSGGTTGFGFGANKPMQQQQSPFGSTNTAFGANTGTNMFGSPSTNTGFGSNLGLGNTNTSAQPFGMAGANTGGAFGSTAGAFGANRPLTGGATPAFGSAGTTSTFGSSASTPFGNLSSAPTPTFGSSFGTPQPSAFGSTTQPNTAFGSTMGASNSAFGATPAQPANSMFGSSNMFGQPQQTQAGFGVAGTSPFSVGGSMGASMGQPQQGGTGNPPFRPQNTTESMNKAGHASTQQLKIHVISAMPNYSSKSLEELRFEDYSRGNRGGGMGSTFGGGMMGSTATSTVSPFGKPAGFGAASTPGFGAKPTGSPFGGTTTSPFGAPAANTGFGATTGGFGFGGNQAQQPATGAAFGGFGSSTPAPAGNTFGLGGGFGSTTTSTGFGVTGTAFGQSAQQQPQTGGFGAFGSTSTTPAFGGGTGFGGNTTAQQQQKPGGFGGFGTTGGTGFGTSNAFGGGATGGFGAPAATNTGTGGFGFGNTNTGGAFGFGKPATGGFGSTTTQPTTGTGFSFGGTNTAPASAGAGQAPGFSFGGFGGTTGAAPSTGFGTTGQTGFGGATGSTGGLGGGFSGFGTTPSTGFGATAQNSANNNQFKLGGTTGGFGGFGTGGGTGGFGGFGSTPAGGNTGFGLGLGANQQQQNQFSLTGQQNVVIPNQPMNQQQQQQLIEHLLALQKKQETQDIDQKVEFLTKKKEELVKTPGDSKTEEEKEKDKANGDSTKNTPNTFSGFSAGSLVRQQTFRPSPRSTTRVVPRGVRGGVNKLNSLLTDSEDRGSDFAGSPLTPSTSTNSSKVLLSPVLSQIGKKGRRLIISTRAPESNVDATTDLPPVPSPMRSLGVSRMAVDNTPAKGTPGSLMDTTFPPSAIAHASDFASSLRSTGEERPLAAETPLRSIETPSHLHFESTPAADREASTHTSSEMKERREGNGRIHFPLSVSPLVTRSGRGSRTPEEVSPEEEENEAGLPQIGGPCPVLTLEGYYTSPNMSVLERMSAEELSAVRKFTVFRPNVGSIEWEGKTDVRGLNLDEIVRIEKKEVFVYEEVETPPLGTGLNKSAIVTLSNVFPKEGSSETKRLQYVHKLEDFCKMNDAEFIKYDLASGEWVFAVKHFSRYGIDDSDDEDEESGVAEQKEGTVEEKADPKGLPLLKPLQYGEASENIQRLRKILGGAVGETASPSAMDVESAELPSHHFSYRSSIIGTHRTAGLLTSPEDQDLADGTAPPSAKRRAPRDVQMIAPFVPSAPTAVDLYGRPSAAQFSVEVVTNVLKLQKDSPCLRMLLELKERSAKATGVPLVSSIASNCTKPGLTKTAKATGIRDYGLAYGRGCRVGWSPSGHFVHPGKGVFSSTAERDYVGTKLVIEKVEPLRWFREKTIGNSIEPIDNLSLFEKPLRAILTASHRDMDSSQPPAALPGSDQDPLQPLISAPTPLWVLPRVDPSELHEYGSFLHMLKDSVRSFTSRQLLPQHPDWALGKALELVDAVFGQERAESVLASSSTERGAQLMPLFEERMGVSPVLWDRRRVALSRWLENATSSEVEDQLELDDGRYGQDVPTYQRIFDLLSVRRIEAAVTLAEDTGLFRLATLLSQLDGDSNLPVLLSNQLELWRYSGADETIPEDLLKIYRVLGADLINVGDKCPSVLTGLGWLRGLSMMFWYGNNGSEHVGLLATALRSYREGLQQGLVDAPVSPFLGDRYPQTKSGLFHLLELLLPTSSETGLGQTSMDVDDQAMMREVRTKLQELLRPEGFTRDPLDYRPSYLILVMLESAGIASPESSYALLVRQHFITQLLTVGLWKWAVFVALQIPHPVTRRAIARDIVLRFAGTVDWEMGLSNFAADFETNGNTFLSHRLKIPDGWIHEATAYRCGYELDNVKHATYLNFAGFHRQARDLVCIEVAPGALLASPSAAESLLKLLESMEPVSSTQLSPVDSYSNVGDIFLGYLRLKDFIRNLSEEKIGKFTAKEKMESEGNDLSEILKEAKTLKARVESLQNKKMVGWKRKRTVWNVVLFDMCGFLQNVIENLERTTNREVGLVGGI